MMTNRSALITIFLTALLPGCFSRSDPFTGSIGNVINFQRIIEASRGAVMSAAVRSGGEVFTFGPFTSIYKVPYGGRWDGYDPASNRVKVVVYYESLCSDTVNFFRNQLTPTYRRLQDIIDLEYVPFGKARARPYRDAYGTDRIHFECQHLQRECDGNRVMSCAQRLLGIHAQFELFSCMMANFMPADGSTPPALAVGQQCATQTGITNWAAIYSCSQRPEGENLLYQNGIKTADLLPTLKSVPTVTVNGVAHDDTALYNWLPNHLLEVICQAHGARHSGCPGTIRVLE